MQTKKEGTKRVTGCGGNRESRVTKRKIKRSEQEKTARKNASIRNMEIETLTWSSEEKERKLRPNALNRCETKGKKVQIELNNESGHIDNYH